jgi:hypothetical protein
MINDLFVAGWLSLKQLIRNNKKKHRTNRYSSSPIIY